MLSLSQISDKTGSGTAFRAHRELIAIEELGQHDIKTVALLFPERGQKFAPLRRRASRTVLGPGYVISERLAGHIAVV